MAMWYLCIRTSVKPRSEWTVTLEEHLAGMRRQHETGAILFSGPTADPTRGIYVIRAATLEAAHVIAAGDPYTAAGACTYELLEWEVHQVLGVGSFAPR